MFVAERFAERCSKVAFSGKFDNNCIQDAVSVGKARLGGGSNSMEVDIVQGTFVKPSIGLALGVTVQANAETCLPVSLVGAGTINIGGFDLEIAIGQTYFDMDLEIEDPGVLNPPEFCA